MSIYRDRYFRYQGRSMWPSFQEGDLVEVEPVDFERLKVGDCLLFLANGNQKIVHRLIDMRKGLRTRGDATAIPDPHKVAPEQVMGRVVYRYRFEQRTRVTGGQLGLLIAIFYRYAGRIDPGRKSRGGQLAKVIRRISSAILRPVWRYGKVRRLSNPEQGLNVFFTLGKTVVGRQDMTSGTWQMSWPWRVFIDPAELQIDNKKL